MANDARAIVHLALDIFRNEDFKQLAILEKIENRLDLQKTQLVNHHVERLMENGCEPFAGIIFTNLVSDLERLGDHAENIAFSLTDEDPN